MKPHRSFQTTRKDKWEAITRGTTKPKPQSKSLPDYFWYSLEHRYSSQVKCNSFLLGAVLGDAIVIAWAPYCVVSATLYMTFKGIHVGLSDASAYRLSYAPTYCVFWWLQQTPFYFHKLKNPLISTILLSISSCIIFTVLMHPVMTITTMVPLPNYRSANLVRRQMEHASSFVHINLSSRPRRLVKSSPRKKRKPQI